MAATARISALARQEYPTSRQALESGDEMISKAM